MTTTIILRPAPVSSRQLTWEPAARRFTGDMSDTNGFGQVFTDACDSGLTIVSATTGREVVFVIDSIDRDADGDVISWTLVPATGRPSNLLVQLWND